MNRQKLALVVLLVLFALSLVYSVVRMPKQKTIDRPAGRPAPAVTPREGGRTSPPPAPTTGATKGGDRLLPLDLDVAPFRGIGRNIFRPIFREEVRIAPLPPPPPAPPRRAEPVKPPQSAPSGGVGEAGKPTAKQEAEKTLGKLRFLGFLGNEGKKTIFLAEGSQIYLVRRGDRIAGKYEVTRLTDEAITITVLSDNSDLVFPLVENRSLTVGKP